MAFSHLRISARAVPERLPATSLGDIFVQTHEYGRAEDAYRHVVEDHPGSDIGREARYRQGLCAFWQRRYDDAFAIWGPLAGTSYDGRIQVHHLDQWFDLGDHQRILDEFARLYQSATADQRGSLVMQWCRYISALTNDPRTDFKHCRPVDAKLLTRYVELHDRLFADEPMADRSTATALLDLGRFDEVVSRFPRLTFESGSALFRLARWDDILRSPSAAAYFRDAALLNSGRSSEIGTDSILYDLGRIKRGHPEQVLANPGLGDFSGMALLALGRLDESLRYSSDYWVPARALSLLGRASEARSQQHDLSIYIDVWQGHAQHALGMCGPHDDAREWIRCLLALQAWIRGDHAAAEVLFARLPDTLPIIDLGRTYRDLLPPFLHGLDGGWSELDARYREIIANGRYRDEQHPWYDAAYVLGQVDDAGFLAQPHCLYAEADLRLCQGMRAEREGRRGDALAAYRAYLALPLYRRSSQVDPVWNTFVDWRVSHLNDEPASDGNIKGAK